MKQIDLGPNDYRTKGAREPIISKGGYLRLAVWIGSIVLIGYIYRSMMTLDLPTVALICIPVIVLCLGLAVLIGRAR